MIYYFTALVIQYTINDNLIDSVVWYDNERHCIEAMSGGYGDMLYNQLYELYGNDIIMNCEVSDRVSYIIKPKWRADDGRQTLGSGQ